MLEAASIVQQKHRLAFAGEPLHTHLYMNETTFSPTRDSEEMGILVFIFRKRKPQAWSTASYSWPWRKAVRSSEAMSTDTTDNRMRTLRIR